MSEDRRPGPSVGKIAFVLEPSDGVSHDILRQVAEVRVGRRDGKYTEEDLLASASDVDALLITSRDGVSRRVMEGCRRLRIIAKYGARPHNVDLQAATELGIAVTYTPGSNQVSVAEHALMMILALLKRLAPSMDAQKRGQWRNDLLPTTELSGKVVGIVGLGQTGSELAKRLPAFEVTAVGFDPWVSRERAEALKVRMVSLEDLISIADVVTLHCDLNRETEHLINRQRLHQMKRCAYLVNTARGGLVGTTALRDALAEGRIAGAALDVFEDEPTAADNPLWRLANVIHTPHMAGVSHEATGRERLWAAEEVVRVLTGQPPKYALNPDYVRHCDAAGR